MKLTPAARENTLFLVDISSFIFRAYYAVRHNLTNRKGEPTNAVYGVAQMLWKLIEDANPKYFTVVYDSKEPSFRKEVYAEYKANRAEAPDDLVPQFARIEELVAKMNLHSVRKSGIEADDLIGTFTHRWLAENKKHEVVIVTGDKDLMQLVTGRVRVWDTMKDAVYGPSEVEAKFGVRPDQVRDYLALVGDSSDNIPGVPSIGPKGAVDLLKEFDTLEGVVKAAKAGKIKGKRGETIAANEKDAFLSQELATLVDVKESKVDLEAMQVTYADETLAVSPECFALLDELDLRSLREKWAKGQSGGAGDTAPGGASPAKGVPAAVSAAPGETGAGTTLVAKADTFRSVLNEKQLIALLDELSKVDEFGFDLETTSLNPREAHLVGIAIAPTAEAGYYIPVGHRGSNLEQLPEKFVLDKLRPFLVDPKRKKVGHNLKYDFSVLAEMGIEADGIGADTMVADYVLDPEGRHNLETVAAKRLNYPVLTYEQVCGKGKDQVPFDLIPIDVATRYSAEDAWVSL
ncbi:MAG: hypothetical protein JST04_18065, partial [Bdellovibrionales bacterium]|nr:hypothetical protein [Bdellovibrionales bacterium]